MSRIAYSDLLKQFKIIFSKALVKWQPSLNSKTNIFHIDAIKLRSQPSCYEKRHAGHDLFLPICP